MRPSFVPGRLAGLARDLLQQASQWGWPTMLIADSGRPASTSVVLACSSNVRIRSGTSRALEPSAFLNSNRPRRFIQLSINWAQGMARAFKARTKRCSRSFGAEVETRARFGEVRSSQSAASSSLHVSSRSWGMPFEARQYEELRVASATQSRRPSEIHFRRSGATYSAPATWSRTNRIMAAGWRQTY